MAARADLETLVRRAREIPVTPEHREEQARSFVHGNVAIENPRVTRTLVDRAFDEAKGRRR